MWCRDLYTWALISKDKKQSKHKTKQNKIKPNENKIIQTIEQGINNNNNNTLFDCLFYLIFIWFDFVSFCACFVFCLC